MLIDDSTHIHIRREHKALVDRDGAAVASFAPVVVLHHATVHEPLSVAHVDHIAALDHAIFEGDHHGSGLERRTGLPKVGDGVVFHFGIDTRAYAREIDDGLDIARLHFHKHHNAYFCVDLLELTFEDLLGRILHPNIYGGDEVQAIDRLHIGLVEPLAAHLLAMHLSVDTSQYAVVGQFEAVAS